MLAQIDEFIFEINETAYEKLKRNVQYKFNSTQRLGNFDNWQNVGKYEETISLDGTLILKSQDQLTEFETMAKEKTPKTLAFTNGTCKTIIIQSLDMEQSNFLNDGKFLKQTFTINLAVVGEGYRYNGK